ncbi:MAG: hypothetical protein NTY29_10565, partial [Proteobacteria bacterium]|nr:hypothetical protein [Pseudomonadota bacterium]
KKRGFEKDWSDTKHTLINQMESGRARHSSGRVYKDTEIKFAKKQNRQPNYAIRIEKSYPVAEVAKLDKHKIIKFFKNEISLLGDCIKFIIQ